MRETLPVALRLMFGAEGGYSNRETDSGGPTKYGITHRTLAASRGVPSVTPAQVEALTLGEAEAIYRKSYWTQAGGDVLPKGLDYAVFDAGVMSGPNRAVKILQQVVGVKADGWIGEQTLAAVRAFPNGVTGLIIAYCAARMAFLRGIKGPTGWTSNGRGWTIRVTGKDPKGQWKPKPGVVGNALALAGGALNPVTDVQYGEPEGTPEGGDAKAEPKPGSPWADPAVILPGAGGLLGSLGTLFAGSGPVQWALAAAIVIAVGAGAFVLVKKLRAVAS